jgi:hypothetical protein
MTSDPLRDYWPPEDQLLLLEAALIDTESARKAWDRWCETRSLDSATWEEVRLLSALLKRVREFDPKSPLLPRLEGIRKFVWSQTQICLNGVRPMLEALSEKRFRLMLIKGAARLARDPRSASERLLRDVDVLVHPDDWEKTLILAKDRGWRCPNWLKLAPSVFPYHHAIPLRDRKGFEVDLHHLAFFVCRNIGDDDGLWARAKPTVLYGLPYFAPSPTDELLLEMSHGFLYSGTASKTSDWVLDVAPLINSDRIDWSVFLTEVRARGLEVSAASGLLLLRERLKLPVPDSLLSVLLTHIDEPFLSDFERSAIQYYPLDKRQVECGTAVASLRAIRNLRNHLASNLAPNASSNHDDSHFVENDPRTYRSIASQPLSGAILSFALLRLIGWTRLKIPHRLDSADVVTLKLRVSVKGTSVSDRGYLLVRAPGLPLKRYDRLKPGNHDLIFEVPAALFRLRGIRHVDFRLSGIPFLNPIKVLRLGLIVRPLSQLSGAATPTTLNERRRRRLRRLEAAFENYWSPGALTAGKCGREGGQHP